MGTVLVNAASLGAEGVQFLNCRPKPALPLQRSSAGRQFKEQFLHIILNYSSYCSSMMEEITAEETLRYSASVVGAKVKVS